MGRISFAHGNICTKTGENIKSFIFRRLNGENLTSTLGNGSRKSLSISSSCAMYNELPKSDEPVDNESEKYEIRDKSRLTPYLKCIKNGEKPDLKFTYQYKLPLLRKHYGTYGGHSNLNPGLCFPTPEELAFKKEYENLAYPPLTEVLTIMRKRQAETAEIKKNREDTIAKNMLNLPKWRKEMLGRQNKKANEVAQLVAKKEEVIAEIREVLGYNVDVKDPRFQEMMEKRAEEEKKRRKLVKKEKRKEMVISNIIETAAKELKKETDEEVDEDEDDSTRKKKR